MGDWPRRLGALRTPKGYEDTAVHCWRAGVLLLAKHSEEVCRYQVPDGWMLRMYVAPSTAQ